MKGQLEVAVKAVSDAFDVIRKEEQRVTDTLAGRSSDDHALVTPKDDATFIEELLKTMNKQHLLETGPSITFKSALCDFADGSYNSALDH